MRRSIASIALIQKNQHGQRLWLAQWNQNWQSYSFVGGHKRPDESFRDCVIREIGEELHITEGIDFLVSDMPLPRLDYVAWSASAQQETHYTMELFEIQLIRAEAWYQIDADPLNRWLTEDEIRKSRCDNGKAVSETMQWMLTKVNLLR